MASTDGSVRIDYGHVQEPVNGADAPSFFTRTITFPVLFTVYHTLEPHDLDILRFSPASAFSAPPEPHSLSTSAPDPHRRPGMTPRSTSFAHASLHVDRLRSALEDEADDDHCLFAISVRNVFGVPFEVCLSRVEGAGAAGADAVAGETRSDEVQSRRLVPPGATER